MPSYQQITSAREKAKRIRQVHSAFKREGRQRSEDTSDIRRALQFSSASEFVSVELA
jgi:hypothetical protein